MIKITNPGGGSTYARYFGDLGGAPSGIPVDGSAYANTVLMQLLQFTGGVWTAIYNLSSIAPPAMTDGEYMGFGGLTYQN